MIDLTPVDVRKKKGDFRRSVRGYEAPAVDEFLDLVAERMEELVKQNVALSDKVARLEERTSEHKEREQALTDALVTAQEVREEVRRQAEKAAELVRREAHADAEQIRAEAMRTRENEEEALRRVRARSGQFLESYRRFLERELAELQVMAESLELRERRVPGERAAGARGPGAKTAPPGAEQDEARWAIAEGASARPRKSGAASEAAESEAAESEAAESEAAEDSRAPALFDSEPAAATDEAKDASGRTAAGDEGGEVGDPDWLSSLRDENA